MSQELVKKYYNLLELMSEESKDLIENSKDFDI